MAESRLPTYLPFDKNSTNWQRKCPTTLQLQQDKNGIFKFELTITSTGTVIDSSFIFLSNKNRDERRGQRGRAIWITADHGATRME